MKYLNKCLVVFWLLICPVTFAAAEMDIDLSLPGENIGVSMQTYPELDTVPGTPVYYAPQAEANYFFYDGLYWVYQDNRWFASTWYNGPWSFIDPGSVPLFVLRVPVRYYRQPPVYFSGWQPTAPPRWNQHWGREWEQRHRGWDRWNHAAVPAPAPLPVYQRQYTGDRYPGVEQQRPLRIEHYRYQPRNRVVRKHLRQHEAQRSPVPAPATPPSARKAPAPLQKVPAPVDKAPAPVQKAPAPAQKVPPTALKAPAPHPEKAPPAARKPPVQTQNTPPAAVTAPPPAQKVLPPAQKAPPLQKAPPPVKKAPPPVQKPPPHVQMAPAAAQKPPVPVPKAQPPAQKAPPPAKTVPPPATVNAPPPAQKVLPPAHKAPPLQKAPPPAKKVPPPSQKAPAQEQKVPAQ